MAFKAEFFEILFFMQGISFRSEELDLPHKIDFCLRKNKPVMSDFMSLLPGDIEW